MKDYINKFFIETGTQSDTAPEPIPYDKWPIAWKTIHYKNYPRFPNLKLPALKPSSELEKVIASRRSQRNINRLISAIKLKKIIYFANFAVTVDGRSYRAYPSGGARYPLEIYIFINNVKGLKKGLYHYSIENNTLEILQLKDFKSDLKQSLVDSWVADSSVFLVITAVPGRSAIKYGDKSLRYIFIEAGHLAQNILLIAEKYKFRTCPIGGFYEDKLNKLLRIDRTNEKAIYSIAIG